MPHELRNQALWLLVLIHLSGRVDGMTRLQKLAFLTSQLIPKVEHAGFYDDWKPSKYGPFSPSLRADTDALEEIGLINREKVAVPGSTEPRMERLAITPNGAQQAEAFAKFYPKIVEMIRKSIIRK